MADNARSGSASTVSSTRTTRRYWRRTDTPRGWWPWGVLPILALLALFLFGALATAPAIEAEVKNGVSQALTGAGVTVSDVSGDGRIVTARIRGQAPGEPYVEALARSTQCDTWAGKLTCPSRVLLQFDRTETPAATPAARPHPFEVLRDADSVILRGEVPNAAVRDRIVRRAGGFFDRVDDQLRITNETTGSNYAPAADRAVALVNRLTDGRASWSGERLSVSGTARAGDIATVRAEFDAIEAPGMLGTFDVRPLEMPASARDECNDAFNEMLSSATIRFQTGSATIDAGNEALLQRLATLANDCPGNLTIEGHTDSRGNADMNQSLSLARASAVREALSRLGVEPGRMNAVGYGEAQPIADNETAEGRARNRRIAISVIPTE